jgi:hypothetical protein
MLNNIIKTKIGRTPIEISWDKYQWIVNYNKEPTYYLMSLESLYNWMLEVSVKTHPKGLVSAEELGIALTKAKKDYQKILKELAAKLDVARSASEVEPEEPKKRKPRKINGSVSTSRRKSKEN